MRIAGLGCWQPVSVTADRADVDAVVNDVMEEFPHLTPGDAVVPAKDLGT